MTRSIVLINLTQFEDRGWSKTRIVEREGHKFYINGYDLSVTYIIFRHEADKQGKINDYKA